MTFLVFVGCFGEAWRRDGMPKPYQENLMLSAQNNPEHKFVILKDQIEPLKLMPELCAMSNVSEKYYGFSSKNGGGMFSDIAYNLGLISPIESHRSLLAQYIKKTDDLLFKGGSKHHIKQAYNAICKATETANQIKRPKKSTAEARLTPINGAHTKDFVQFVTILAVNCLAKIYNAPSGVAFLDLDNVLMGNLSLGRFCDKTGLQFIGLKFSCDERIFVEYDTHRGLCIRPNALCLPMLFQHIKRIVTSIEKSEAELNEFYLLMPENAAYLRYTRLERLPRNAQPCFQGMLNQVKTDSGVVIPIPQGVTYCENCLQEPTQCTNIKDKDDLFSLGICDGLTVINMFCYADWNGVSKSIRLHGIECYALLQISLGYLLQYCALLRSPLKDREAPRWFNVYLNYALYLSGMVSKFVPEQSDIFDDLGVTPFEKYQSYLSNTANQTIRELAINAEARILSKDRQDCQFITIKQSKLSEQCIRISPPGHKVPTEFVLYDENRDIYPIFSRSNSNYLTIIVTDPEGNEHNLAFLLSVAYGIDEGFERYCALCQSINEEQVRPVMEQSQSAAWSSTALNPMAMT